MRARSRPPENPANCVGKCGESKRAMVEDLKGNCAWRWSLVDRGSTGGSHNPGPAESRCSPKDVRAVRAVTGRMRLQAPVTRWNDRDCLQGSGRVSLLGRPDGLLLAGSCSNCCARGQPMGLIPRCLRPALLSHPKMEAKNESVGLVQQSAPKAAMRCATYLR
jgi:hypothetical protein